MKQEKEYLIQILNHFKVTQEYIDGVLESPYLRTAKTVEDFKKNIDEYVEAFGHLFKYGKRPYGRGELLPLLSIRQSRIGGAKEKDITVGNIVLEVKELDNGKYFDTASGGSISGTCFLENIQMFFRYLEQADTEGIYRERIKYFKNTFSKGGVSAGELKNIEKVLEEINKDVADTHYIKYLNTRYLPEPGKVYTLTVDTLGNVTTTLPKVSNHEVFINKLHKHPWVLTKGEQLRKDLKQIQENYLQDIDYLLLYKRGQPYILNKEEALEQLYPYRISLGNLHLGFTKYNTIYK